MKNIVEGQFLGYLVFFAMSALRLRSSLALLAPLSDSFS